MDAVVQQLERDKLHLTAELGRYKYELDAKVNEIRGLHELVESVQDDKIKLTKKISKLLDNGEFQRHDNKNEKKKEWINLKNKMQNRERACARAGRGQVHAPLVVQLVEHRRRRQQSSEELD